MKKIFLTILAAASILAGCEKKPLERRGYGEFVLDGMGVDTKMSEDSKPSLTRASVTLTPEEEKNIINSMTISLKSDSPDGYSKDWPNFAEIAGKSVEVPAGKYTMTAVSSDKRSVAWNNPKFSGEAKFPVEVGAMTPVTIKCSVSNMAVTLKCTPEFMRTMSKFQIKVSAKGNKETFCIWEEEFFDKATGELTGETAKNHTAAWFDVDDLNVEVTGTWSDKGETTLVKGIVKTIQGKAKDYVTVIVDSKPTGMIGGGEGDSPIKVTIDSSTNDREENLPPVGGTDFEEVPDIEEPEEPLDPNAPPTMEWKGNENFDPMPLVSDMAGKVKITIKVPSGIEEFVVDVESNILNENSMISIKEIDFINPGQDLGSVLEGVGLETGESLIGETSLELDLSALVPMILNLASNDNKTPDPQHKFSLTIVDSKGQTLNKDCIFTYAE